MENNSKRVRESRYILDVSKFTYPTWVQAMYVSRNTEMLKIGEPCMCRHSLGTQETERSSMGRKVVQLT
jgi:hypothetical protein